MSTLELKGGLYDMISGIDNKELLFKLKQVITETIDEDSGTTDFWDELTVEQQQSLEQALQESEREENLVDHQVVINKYKQWPNK